MVVSKEQFQWWMDKNGVSFTHRDDSKDVKALQAKVFFQKASSTIKLSLKNLREDQAELLPAVLPHYQQLEAINARGTKLSPDALRAILQSRAEDIYLDFCDLTNAEAFIIAEELAKAPHAAGSGSLQEAAKHYGAQVDVLDQQQAASSQVSGKLPAGTVCRYEPTSSTEFPFLKAVVQGFNPLDRTYNLDVRPHAQPSRIAPVRDITTQQAWSCGVLVDYYGESLEKEGAGRVALPAVVVSFNEGDQTYNLDVRDHADCGRIRLRV